MNISIILELSFLLWIIIDILELYNKISKAIVYKVEMFLLGVITVISVYNELSNGNRVMMEWLSQHIVFDIIMVITMIIFMGLNVYMAFRPRSE